MEALLRFWTADRSLSIFLGLLILIYYSFVTLTTMGYGDISPVHAVARSLTILEALTGQLYLAITLARLVALHMKSGEQG